MSFVLSGVTYSYPRAGQPALRAASLEVPAGKTTVLLGPSGSGKSTLMSLLGLLWEGRLDQGEIRYDNGHMHDYARLSHVDRARLRLVEFGFVLQSAYLLPHFSCSRNIALPLELNGQPPAAARQRVEALLRRADPSGELFETRDRLPGEVSGGQKQRVAVLRAVAHNPRVVFADEPFSNLDPPNARRIVQLLLDWRSGALNPDDPARERTLVLVCHDLEVARRVADRVALLDQGHTVVDGRAFDIVEWEDWADRIRRAFSDDLDVGERGV
ncbi:MAG: ATP-binding cassette domain-containing protein [Planctomycetes bacterium]|nr:ATP-binding cassette domain-containing protein [Planctomycetota bacterium]